MSLNSINPEVEKYLETLKNAGFRLTNQRKMIIRTLLENIGEHPNAQELLEMVQKEDPSIGIATVYRTVELLNQMDILNLSNREEGFRRYEISDEKIHLHFYCRCCGKVIHTRVSDDKKKILGEWAQEENFTILPQTFEICGICEDCQKDISKTQSPDDIYIACRNKCVSGNFEPGQGRQARRGRGRRCQKP